MSRRLFDAMEEVGERVVRAPHLLLCFDFDGTLAPIAEEPALVCLSPHMRRVVLSLADHDGVSLAVISGRDRADLQTRVGIPGLIYAGNHGLEISGPGCVFVEPAAAARSAALKELAVDLADKLYPVAGAWVEYKGLTLSIHYRQVADADCAEVRRQVQAALASTEQLFQLTRGDKTYDIRPRVGWNKGTAIDWIREQLGLPDTLAIYLGDDTTDENAFRALPEGITVKVGGPSATAARYRLENPAEVRRFLEWVEGLLRQKTECAAEIVAPGADEREISTLLGIVQAS